MIDLRLSDQELAEQLLREHPKGTEISEEWVDQKRGDMSVNPARFVLICELAGNLTDSVERQATFKLEIVNVKRRMRDWDPANVEQLMEQAEKLIMQIDGPRRRRLHELWTYHAGLVYRETGRFDLAAQAQEKSARLALNPATAAISRFCVVVEWAHYAFQMGHPDRITANLAALRLASDELLMVQTDEGHAALERWQKVNRPVHLLYCHWLANERYVNWSVDLRGFLNHGIVKQYTAWDWVFRAIMALEQNNLSEEAVYSANKALELDFHAVTTTLAMLVLARVNMRKKFKGVARIYLRAIVSLSGHGGHFVRAVAARELAKLE